MQFYSYIKEGESYISIPYLAVLVQVTDEHLEARLHLGQGASKPGPELFVFLQIDGWNCTYV